MPKLVHSSQFTVHGIKKLVNGQPTTACPDKGRVNRKSRGFTLIELLVACHPKHFLPNEALAKLGRRKAILPAFTLIELLVVITILGILAGLTLATFGGTQARSRDSRRKTDLDAIKKALELAKQDSTGSYYYPACSPAATSCPLTTGTDTNPNLTTGTTPYIKTIPTDPKTGSYTYIPTPASCTSATCSSYSLYACLENARDTQKDSTNLCTSPLVSYTVKPN